MADYDLDMATTSRAPKPNREQRRDEEFGRQPRPTIPSPFSADDLPANQEAVAGRPDQGQPRTTGPGTGGATQHDDRVPEIPGAHPSNSAKG